MTSKLISFRAGTRTQRQIADFIRHWRYQDGDNTSELYRRIIDTAHAATFGQGEPVQQQEQGEVTQ
jgi:hypothetical protein